MKKFKQKKNFFSKKKFLIEDGAQSGAVFRLMIDAIIGLVILIMIFSTISYFNYLRLQTSIDEFNLKIISAINSPDGRVIESNNALLFFRGTTFSNVEIQEMTAYPSECFKFESNLSFVNIGHSGDYAEILENTETRVYFRCESTHESYDFETQSGCDIECIISFGRRLEDLSDFN